MEKSSEFMTEFSEPFCTYTEFFGYLYLSQSLSIIIEHWFRTVEVGSESVINNLEFLLIYFMDICDSSVLPMQFNYNIYVLETSEE
jgi:hypothetical protein